MQTIAHMQAVLFPRNYIEHYRVVGATLGAVCRHIECVHVTVVNACAFAVAFIFLFSCEI